MTRYELGHDSGSLEEHEVLPPADPFIAGARNVVQCRSNRGNHWVSQSARCSISALADASRATCVAWTPGRVWNTRITS